MKLDGKIIRLRKERNLSQERLAEEIGVSRQAVTKWETGESLPELEKLVLLAAYFGVTVDSLLKDDEGCARPSAPQNTERSALVRFLCTAKKNTYAGNRNMTESSRTNSHDLRYTEGNFAYYDTYLGGERFSGEEAVWQNDVPVWAMNYTGRVLDESFPGDFLKEALFQVPQELPFRGPSVYVKNEYSYHCCVNGSFEWFSGYEEILVRNRKVFECLFHGGIVE